MHRWFLPGVILFALLTGCSASGDAGTAATTPPQNADVVVVAQDFAFDTAEIRLTAGRETVLYFDNRDAEGHNVSIYRQAGGEQLFGGDIVADGGIAYRIPPLEPGTYHFQCDPHPVMSGTVVVEEASS